MVTIKVDPEDSPLLRLLDEMVPAVGPTRWIGDFGLIISEAVPEGQIWFSDGTQLVGKIINIRSN